MEPPASVAVSSVPSREEQILDHCLAPPKQSNRVSTCCLIALLGFWLHSLKARTDTIEDADERGIERGGDSRRERRTEREKRGHEK